MKHTLGRSSFKGMKFGAFVRQIRHEEFWRKPRTGRVLNLPKSRCMRRFMCHVCIKMLRWCEIVHLSTSKKQPAARENAIQFGIVVACVGKRREVTQNDAVFTK